MAAPTAGGHFECVSDRGFPPQVFGYPGQAPIAGTEGEFSASVIGCTYYIIVAVIWSMIWCVAT
jgi:hypothetical protein